ncbi:GNAT domain-containing protein, partial [Cadophora sp. MPI-SDFR-AT-0126]
MSISISSSPDIQTAISTSSILLVPYEASHVPTYHEWMKDEQIQAETASEPLTLEEEYAMQRSWRTDADKLTFIACLPLPSASSSANAPSSTTPLTLIPGQFDTPTHLLGDVNLFLTPSTSTSPTLLTGELELMIAPTTHRRKGHGRAAILSFLTYISAHLPAILSEYGRSQSPPIPEGDVRLEGLRVKIGVGNERSLGLFRGLGFAWEGKGEGEGEKVNYFGEVELWFKGELTEEGMRGLRER